MKAVCGHPAYLLINLYAEYIMRNTGLGEAQAWIKIAGENVNNLRYADDTMQTQLLPIQENFDLRECQSPVNWELVNMKYLVVFFLLLYCRHV